MTVNTAKRREIVALHEYLVVHRARVHYPWHDLRTQSIHHVGSLADVYHLVAEGVTIDCSQAVTMVCLAAGLKNPNGGDTDGYTGTLLDNLPHYTDPAQAYPGALAVFGRWPGHHVAQVHERGHDPWVFSHGQESDPRILRLSWEAAGQAAAGHPGVTMLSIAHL